MHRLIYKKYVKLSVLALTMAFLVSLLHVYPGMAAEKSAKPVLTTAKKILYIEGSKGRTVEGKQSKYRKSLKVQKLIKGFDPKKQNITLKSSSPDVASVDSDKDYIYAKGVGTAEITVTVNKKGKSKKTVFTGVLTVTVKKNADEDSFIVEGIRDGQSVYTDDVLNISMPGDYTDLKALICDDEDAVTIVPSDDGAGFSVSFTDPGEYLITAYAYQSKKYNAPVVFKDFEVTVKDREAEIKQVSMDSVTLTGGPVDEDMEASDFTVYEIDDGIKMFYSYISKINLKDRVATVTSFKPFVDNKDYILEYDNLEFSFKSASCGVLDVDRFEIVEDSVLTGTDKQLSYKYFTKDGIDITQNVSKKLDPDVLITIGDNENKRAFVSNNRLYILDNGLTVNVKAELSICSDSAGSVKKVLSTEKQIKSVEKKEVMPTGIAVFTVASDDKEYLKYGEKYEHSVPMGDRAVLEALFEMDDGSYKNFKNAGITDFIVGDKSILMMGKALKNGGYELILNNEGVTSVVAMRGELVAGEFEISVLPARKVSELKVELTKSKLNTNALVDDYVLIKADLVDQYGSVVEGGSFDIKQDETNKKEIGEVHFNQISKGRFVLYGYECKADVSSRKIYATVYSGDYSGIIDIDICDVAYSDGPTEYNYKFKMDGNKVIDTAPGMASESPKSTVLTVEITDNEGYFLGEGIGTLFEDYPSVVKNAAFYGIDPGDSFYGITVEYESEKGEKKLIGEETDCIIPSYLDLEFIPYVYGEKLESGTYTMTIYKVTGGDEYSEVEKYDSVSIKVIDTDPDIEIQQLLQNYDKIPEKGWESVISDFFSFKYDGEDISGYVKKVDCVEAASGSVFIRSVDFVIPNPYFGPIRKTATVERLITKQ
ncbi:MAG: hypothetical protein K6G24_04315 [Lachnospiraceae bacterium]|nr:hypothetical protein [Lachnospiraceae bacterium]